MLNIVRRRYCLQRLDVCLQIVLGHEAGAEEMGVEVCPGKLDHCWSLREGSEQSGPRLHGDLRSATGCRRTEPEVRGIPEENQWDQFVQKIHFDGALRVLHVPISRSGRRNRSFRQGD